MRNPEIKEQKKREIMEKCYDCYCEYGLNQTGMKALAKACGMTPANLYVYFDNLDQLILESTAYCMAKVEDDFMAWAPQGPGDVEEFLDKVPKWTAEKHGKKYRFMYQVYTSPKYLEYGKKFFVGVTERYTQYAKELEPKLGISWQLIQPMIYMMVRASVHYALFEEDEYLKPQIDLIKKMLALAMNGSIK